MNARLPMEPTDPLPSSAAEKWRPERVTWTHHWTPALLSFRTTRPEGFRFKSGHYARLGLVDASGDTAWRPFSMVSGADDDFLEFLAVLVPGGEFSQRMGVAKLGDTILVDKLTYGFLTLDQLAPGGDLWLFASGTGLGPFMSILRDRLPWRSFDHLILVHSVRLIEELAYRNEIVAIRDSATAAGASATLHYIPVVTRDISPGMLQARIPQLIVDGRLEYAATVPLESHHSRAMVCGNPALIRDMRSLLSARGFATSRRHALGQMAFEKYW